MARQLNIFAKSIFTNQCRCAAPTRSAIASRICCTRYQVPPTAPPATAKSVTHIQMCALRCRRWNSAPIGSAARRDATVTAGTATAADTSLRPFDAVLGPALVPEKLGTVRTSAFWHRPACVKSTADDVVLHSGKVWNATTPYEHDRVLLEVVVLAGNVGRHLLAVGETHPGDLAHSRVWLLRLHRLDAQADATLLRAPLQRRRFDLLMLRPSSVATNELIDRRHVVLSFSSEAGDSV